MVCTSRFSPSLIHGLCAFFASNSRFMRLFQAALDTRLDSPFSATLSVHGLHFTFCAPSINLKSRKARTSLFNQVSPLKNNPVIVTLPAKKVLEKFGENSEQTSGQNSGRNIEKFGKLLFCNFPDLLSYSRIQLFNRFSSLREFERECFFQENLASRDPVLVALRHPPWSEKPWLP